MELNISDVVIEVTRKCNMQCEHCLRGDVQNKTLDNKYIDKLFSLIDTIHCLSITGGEPTLAMDKLDHIEQCARYAHADVDNFFMVTNGKSIHVNKLAEWVWNMQDACQDNEISAVTFSFDNFHRNTFNCQQLDKQERNFHRLWEILEEDYGLYNSCDGAFVYKHTSDRMGYRDLVKEGRAKNFGGREVSVDSFEEDTWADYVSFSDSQLYLSCSGWLVSGCDWSYNTIDNDEKVQIAHIDDINSTDDLIKAIREYNKKHDLVHA